MKIKSERRKELLTQFKTRKTDMGIYRIMSAEKDKCFLDVTNDLVGTMNGSFFKLKTGTFPNRELQKEWKTLGEDKFIIEILEKLPYDEEGIKEDYTEELQLLKLIWEEVITKEEMKFYRR